MKRKMTRSAAILSTGIGIMMLSLASCSKSVGVVAPTSNTAATTNFQSIKTSSNYTWSNTKTISFSFTGLQSNNYFAILKVLAPDRSVLFQRNQNGSQNFTGSFTIPADCASVTVEFGGVTKTFVTKNGSIGMNLN